MSFTTLGIAGVGSHTFRHSVGSILAGAPPHHSVANQYLQAATKTKRILQIFCGLVGVRKNVLESERLLDPNGPRFLEKGFSR